MPGRRWGTESCPSSGWPTLSNPYDTAPGEGAGPARTLHLLAGTAVATGAAIAMSGTAAADTVDVDPFSSESSSGWSDTGDAFAGGSFDTDGAFPGGSSGTDDTFSSGSFDLATAPPPVAPIEVPSGDALDGESVFDLPAAPVPAADPAPVPLPIEAVAPAPEPLPVVVAETDGGPPPAAPVVEPLPAPLPEPLPAPLPAPDPGFAPDVLSTPQESAAEDGDALRSVDEAMATGPTGGTDPTTTPALDALPTPPTDPADAGLVVDPGSDDPGSDDPGSTELAEVGPAPDAPTGPDALPEPATAPALLATTGPPPETAPDAVDTQPLPSSVEPVAPIPAQTDDGAAAADSPSVPAAEPELGFAQGVVLTPYQLTAEDQDAFRAVDEALTTGPIGVTDRETTAALDALLFPTTGTADGGSPSAGFAIDLSADAGAGTVRDLPAQRATTGGDAADLGTGASAPDASPALLPHAPDGSPLPGAPAATATVTGGSSGGTGPAGTATPGTATPGTATPGTATPGTASTGSTPAPSTTGPSSSAPPVATSVRGSAGPEDEPTSGEDEADDPSWLDLLDESAPDDDTSWSDLFDEVAEDDGTSWWVLEEGAGDVRATNEPPPPAGRPKLPWWAVDENVLGYRDLGSWPVHAMQLHPEAFRAQPLARTERQDGLYQFGRDMSTILGVPFEGGADDFLDDLVAAMEAQVRQDAGLGEEAPQEDETPQGATASAAHLFDLWQQQFDRDIQGYDPSLPQVPPQAREAYLCLAAVRCVGAPPEATIYAGAALANLLGSHGEMTPEGVEEVLTAAEQSMLDLEAANEIAGSFLPDARLGISSDARLNETIQLSNQVAPNETVADLLASRFLPEAHAAGPNGAPRTDPLPGSPVELGILGVSGNYLRGWRDGTIPPVELAALEATCQEMARFVCETGYRIPGSSAAPNVLASPQRQADLEALNTALHEYWTSWRADPESDATLLAWVNVEMSKENLARSMRRQAGERAGDPAPPQVPVSARPGEVAGVTSEAQTRVLDALFRNLPTRTGPDGTPLTFADFTAALLGPARVTSNDATFRIPDGAPVVPGEDESGQHGTSALVPSGRSVLVPAPAPTTAPTGAGDGSSEHAGEAGEPAERSRTRERSTAQGGGVVIAPELPRPEDPIGDMIAGGRPGPVVELPAPDAPGGDPVDPSEFDPNRTPDLVPVDPGAVQETFPGRDEALERILAPDGVRGQFRSPLGDEEAPAGEPTRPGETPTGGGTTGSQVPVAAVQQAPTRYAPLPGGRQGIVIDQQQLAGTGGPRDTPGTLTLVEDTQTGQRYVSVQPTRVTNPDGTQTVFIPRLPGRRVGYNPIGQTAAVYQLPPGQTGRVTPSTPVDQVRVRTEPGTPLRFNGGGGPNAIPGMAYRDRVYDNPTLEEWTIFPATTTDYDTGVRTYTAQVPAGHENQVDLTQDGIIRLRVPAGSRPVAVSQTEQAFTPYVPTPMPTYHAPAATPAASTPARTPSPALTPPPAATTPRTATPQPAQPSAPTAQPQQGGVGGFIDDTVQRGGQLLDQTGQAARRLWNDQPVTVRDLPAGQVEVTFTDGRVGRYDSNGDRVGGSGPAWVSPLQTATPGRALDEAGQIFNGVGEVLRNLPPLPIPGWNPLERAY